MKPPSVTNEIIKKEGMRKNDNYLTDYMTAYYYFTKIHLNVRIL